MAAFTPAFEPLGNYVNCVETALPHHFLQERALALPGFDEGDPQVGCHQLQRQSGEAGARADVDEPTAQLDDSAQVKRFPEKPAHDRPRVAQAGEVDAAVPAKQELEVERKLLQPFSGQLDSER